MPWRYAQLRDARVLARCDDEGHLLVDQGRVEIRYDVAANRFYRAAVRNLNVYEHEAVLPDDACGQASSAGATAGEDKGKRTVEKARLSIKAPLPEGALIAYTDGACSGNPGPCGVGVVMIDGDARREYSAYLGRGTNNIAELTAIQVAADAASDPNRPIRIHTDSSYAIGVLTKGWKAKANVELIGRIKRSLARLSDVGLIYVKGHAGIEDNERADRLAVAAVEARATAGWADLR